MKSLLARVWQQLQLVYRLTFQPDLDSAIYLNRTRLNIAALSMLVLDAVYVLLWLWVFNKTTGSIYVLALAASASALAFVNLQWRFIPKVSQLAVVIFSLWLNMPVLAFYIYCIAASPVQALANTIILLMLYMHIQDWRSSLLGVVLAAAVSPVLYFFGMGTWPAWPPLLQIFILCSAIVGAVVVSASSANITKMRKYYAQKVLKVTQEQLRPALQLQTELLGNMRYEARNILQDERQRLALDELAQNLQAEITQLQDCVMRLVQAGPGNLGHVQAIGMLHTSEILRMVRHDLMANYHFQAQDLDAMLRPQLHDDVVIEANGAEISQALAAMLAPMLQAAGQVQQQATFTLDCWQHAHTGKLRIHLQTPENANSAPSSHHASSNLAPRPNHLPPFTAYIFRLFHVSWQVHASFAGGIPSDITLSSPLPSHAGAASLPHTPSSSA